MWTANGMNPRETNDHVPAAVIQSPEVAHTTLTRATRSFAEQSRRAAATT